MTALCQDPDDVNLNLGRGFQQTETGINNVLKSKSLMVPKTTNDLIFREIWNLFQR